MLRRSIDVQAMFIIFGEQIELQTTAIDTVICLFCHPRFMRRSVNLVATTTIFAYIMIFETQFRIGACLQIRTETDCLILQFRKFCKSVAVIVISGPMTVLSENIQSRTMIVSHQRSIQRCVIIKRGTSSDRSNGMRQLTGVT